MFWPFQHLGRCWHATFDFSTSMQRKLRGHFQLAAGLREELRLLWQQIGRVLHLRRQIFDLVALQVVKRLCAQPWSRTRG